MRLAALADVHGNLPALEAVLKDIKRQGVDHVVVAGDIVHGMAWPQEVIDRLRSIGALMIRGNNEDYLIAYHRKTAPERWYTAQQWSALRWTYRHLNDETCDFIAALPAQRVVALEGTDAIWTQAEAAFDWEAAARGQLDP